MPTSARNQPAVLGTRSAELCRLRFVAAHPLLLVTRSLPGPVASHWLKSSSEAVTIRTPTAALENVTCSISMLPVSEPAACSHARESLLAALAGELWLEERRQETRLRQI